MAAALPRAIELPRFKHHSTFWPPLNQELTSRCIVYDIGGVLMASPNRHRRDIFTPAYLADRYLWAQRNDEWPGEEPAYYGTSLNAGCKAFREVGLIDSWYHARSMSDVEAWILTKHPVSVGVTWYSSFDTPDPKTGIVTIAPGAFARGGHAFMVSGYNRETGLFHCQNSWGPGWGIYGRFKIPYDVMERLLFQEWGDAVGIVEAAA
jgi:hypothetical protein